MPLSNPSNPIVRSGTVVTSSVAATTTVTTLLNANATRNMASFYNDSTADLYIKLGSAASLTDWSVKLSSGQFYELPDSYTGIVTGLWSAANGQCRVSDFN